MTAIKSIFLSTALLVSFSALASDVEKGIKGLSTYRYYQEK